MLELEKIEKQCSQCLEIKNLTRLFSCVGCGEVFCNEHAAYKDGLLCVECDENDRLYDYAA